MTEKRFTYGETIDYNFFDVFEEKKYLGMIQRDSTKIIDRLNELVEENEQLRNELDKYKIVILQFVGLLVENGIIDSSVKEEVDELLEELSGDGG